MPEQQRLRHANLPSQLPGRASESMLEKRLCSLGKSARNSTSRKQRVT
jgi:hypothetical protein